VRALRTVLLWSTVWLLTTMPGTALASSLLSAEVVLAAEVSERGGLTGEATGSQRNAVGFEWFGTLGGRAGDVLRFDVQARLSHDAEGPGDPGPGLEVHNAWMECRLALGRTVRVGHFAPAFGLEPDVDTHGTLLQTLAGPDMGFKKDWGLAWSGLLGPGDLSAAIQTGSGAALDRRDGSYLATSRLTLPAGPNTTVGLSVLRGRTLVSPDARTLPRPDVLGGVDRARVGADLLLDEGNSRVLAELSLGADDGRRRGSFLARFERTPLELPRLTVSAQGELIDERGRGRSTVTLALSYRLSDRWTASGALSRLAGQGHEGASFRALLYYLGRIG
jgi:hypothetical protein